MTITLELPEKIAKIVQSKRVDLPRFVLESLAMEAYRARSLPGPKFRSCSASIRRLPWMAS